MHTKVKEAGEEEGWGDVERADSRVTRWERREGGGLQQKTGEVAVVRKLTKIAWHARR